MKRLIFSILCLIFSTAFVLAQTPPPIQAGFTVERELGDADKHNYEVNLTKGQMLNFVVEQRGVDVVLRVFTADGKFYDRLDTPNGTQGDEAFKMVSPGGGRYRVEINRWWGDNTTTGKYFVKTVEIRKATDAEMKAVRLKDELLKIVAEDNRYDSDPAALKRIYLDKALLTNPLGFVFNAAEMIELTTKNPPKLPEGASNEVEFSEARMEDFGDVAVLSVSRSRRLKNPKVNLDQTAIQSIGYVFKRTGGGWRIINVQRTYAERERKPVKLDAKQLDALIVGVYDGGKPYETLAITREGNGLYGKFPEEEKFELLPDADNTFYAGFISIAFVRDAIGAVTQAVVHYSMPEDRMGIKPKVK